MKTHYVLIDFENVRVESLKRLKREERFRIWIFIGPTDKKLPTQLVLDVDELNERARFVQVEMRGSNAVDFHITYYLGTLVSAEPTGFFHIITKDKGSDPLLRHLHTKGISAARSESIDEMPCFKDAKTDCHRSTHAADELLLVVLEDLKRRKTSKPRTEKTLLSTIHARCGKERPRTQIEEIYQTMKQRGYIRLDGKQVTYKLPEEGVGKR